MATALEAYCVDDNRYPPVPEWPAAGWDDPRDWLRPLTTPVSYISSLPRYTWEPWVFNWGSGDIRMNYFYYNNRNSFEVEEPSATALKWNIWDAKDTSRWYMSATGPDGDLDQDWTNTPGSNNQPYDPTNGSTSSGDIIRIGP